MMEENKKKIWNLLWAVLAVGVFYAVSNLLGLAGYVAIPKWLIPIKQEQASSYMFIVDMLISVILLVLSFFAYKRLGKNQSKTKMAVSGNEVLKCLMMGIAIFAINTSLDMLLFPSAGGGRRESLISMILTGVIFAPLIEECFFRGVVYNLLSRFRKGWVPVLLSALIFGAYHVDFYQIIYTTILGIVLALVYQRTENIVYPIVVHMANNASVCIATSRIPEIAQKAFYIGAVVMVIPAAVFLVRDVKNSNLICSSTENQ